MLSPNLEYIKGPKLFLWHHIEFLEVSVLLLNTYNNSYKIQQTLIILVGMKHPRGGNILLTVFIFWEYCTLQTTLPNKIIADLKCM